MASIPRLRAHVAIQQPRVGEFYTRMLAGSSMTSIIDHSKRKSLTTPNVLNIIIMEMLPLVAFKNHGITALTGIKAAWALVLAEMAATPDIEYGHIVSGRSLPLDGVEPIMRP